MHLYIMQQTSQRTFASIPHVALEHLRFRAHAVATPARKRCRWLYSCWCFSRRESESPLPAIHDDYVNRDAVREYANRDSLCEEYGDDYANRDAIREARERERERDQRERQAIEYREYVNAPSTWRTDDGSDDNRNTQRRQTHRSELNNFLLTSKPTGFQFDCMSFFLYVCYAFNTLPILN